MVVVLGKKIAEWKLNDWVTMRPSSSPAELLQKRGSFLRINPAPIAGDGENSSSFKSL